jgi:excisionase family DNA binding protein
MTRLLTVKQVAEQLQVHPQTVYKLISRRQLDSVRLGSRSRRVPQEALEAYAERLSTRGRRR